MTQAMRFDVSAADSASATFVRIGEAVDRLQAKLNELDRTRANPKITLDFRNANRNLARFTTRFENAISRLRTTKLKVDLDVADDSAIGLLRDTLATLSDKRVRIDLDVADNSQLAELTAALTALTDRRVTVDIDVADSGDLATLQAALAALSDARVQVDLDVPNTDQVNDLLQRLLDLEALSPVQIRIELQDDATAGLTAIQALADALAQASPTVRVDADVIAATAALAAILAQIAAIAGSSPTVNVNVNTLTFLGQLARIRQELRSLHGNIELNADTRQAMEELARLRIELARLEAMEASPVVDADTELARHRIELIEQQLARLDGQTATARVRVDVDRSLSDAIVRVAALGRALATLAIPVAIAGGIPLLVGLAAAASQATGAIGLLPGALLAGGAAAATLKVGLQGVGDALKETDPAAFAEALKGLAPAAAEFATVVRSLGPAWDSVRLDTQQALFAGLGAEMQRLSSAYLPGIRAGLTGIASGFSGLAKDLVGFATSASSVRDVDTIFRNTRASLEAARPAAVNLARAFLDIGTVGAQMLPELASGLTNVTGRFAEFIAQARASGELEAWIRRGVDALQTLGSIAGNVGSILGSIFGAAEQAGAGFLTTLDTLTGALADFLATASTQSALISFFREAKATVDALLPGLHALGDAAAAALGAFSNTGALSNAAAAFTNIAQAVAPLGAALGTLAGGAINALASALATVTAAVAPLVSGLAGLLGSLGPIPGLVTAAVVAFLALRAALSVATIQSFALGLGLLAERMGLAAGAATALSAGVATLLRWLAPIAAAFVLVQGAIQQASGDLEGWAKGMLQGGDAARQARADFEAHNAQFREGSILAGLFAKDEAELTAEIAKQRAEMSPLAQAQADVAMAQDRWNAAVKEFGPSSSQAAAAAETLASATDREAQASDDAARAGRSHADQIRDTQAAMESAIGASLNYEDAVRRTAQAHRDALAAEKEHGAGSEQAAQAATDLARAMLNQADAAKENSLAMTQNLPAIDQQRLAQQAWATEILRTADVASGPGRAALASLTAGMNQTQLDTISATASMSGLSTEIHTLPDGRKVTVVVAADRAQLDQAKTAVLDFAATKYVGTVTINAETTNAEGAIVQVVTLANGTTASIQMDANGAPALIKVGQTKYTIDTTTGVMTVDGNVAPGEASLAGYKLHVDQSTGQVSILANDAPARGTHGALIGQVNSSEGTITINGNAEQARSQTGAAVQFANGSTGTIRIDGNPDPATGKVSATVTYANGSTGRITVDANDAAARAKIASLQRPTFSVHTIRVSTTGDVSGVGQTGRAAGGYFTPAAMATGGVRRISAARAQVVHPRQPRLIGDRMRGDEAFIPINRSRRSRGILATTANSMGYRLAPKRMADGGMLDRLVSAGLPSRIAIPTPAAGTAGVTRKDIAELIAAVREGGGAPPITVEDRSGNPTETARAVQLTMRMSRR